VAFCASYVSIPWLISCAEVPVKGQPEKRRGAKQHFGHLAEYMVYARNCYLEDLLNEVAWSFINNEWSAMVPQNLNPYIDGWISAGGESVEDLLAAIEKIAGVRIKPDPWRKALIVEPYDGRVPKRRIKGEEFTVAPLPVDKAEWRSLMSYVSVVWKEYEKVLKENFHRGLFPTEYLRFKLFGKKTYGWQMVVLQGVLYDIGFVPTRKGCDSHILVVAQPNDYLHITDVKAPVGANWVFLLVHRTGLHLYRCEHPARRIYLPKLRWDPFWRAGCMEGFTPSTKRISFAELKKRVNEYIQEYGWYKFPKMYEE